MLGLVSKERFEQLAEDGPFMAFLASVEEDLQRYLDEPRWYQALKTRDPPKQIAYFSPEFGVERGASDLLGGPGGSGRRPPEGRQRPRRAARRRRSALPAGLLPPAPERRRVAAGALSRRSTRTAMPLTLLLDDDGAPLEDRGRPRRCALRRSAVAGDRSDACRCC